MAALSPLPLTAPQALQCIVTRHRQDRQNDINSFYHFRHDSKFFLSFLKFFFLTLRVMSLFMKRYLRGGFLVVVVIEVQNAERGDLVIDFQR